MIEIIRELKDKIERQGLRPTVAVMNVHTYQKLKALACNSTYFTNPNRRPATVLGLDIMIDNNIMDDVIAVKDLMSDAQAIGCVPAPKCKPITINRDRYFNIEVDDVQPWGWFRDGKIPNESLPVRYIVNDDACILFWDSKGKVKTVVKRCKDDNIDPIKAFLWAYFEKTSGMSKTKANKYLQKVEVDYQNYKEN
jgi:hypothetical protein